MPKNDTPYEPTKLHKNMAFHEPISPFSEVGGVVGGGPVGVQLCSKGSPQRRGFPS